VPESVWDLVVTMNTPPVEWGMIAFTMALVKKFGVYLPILTSYRMRSWVITRAALALALAIALALALALALVADIHALLKRSLSNIKVL
jgi:hypothetical protein